MSILSGLNVSQAAIADFCRRRKVIELGIFGSVARGDARPDSDVDVMVRFAPDAEWSLWDFVEIKDELAGLFSREVDLVEKGAVGNPFRRRTIDRDLTVVYAA